MDRPALLEPAAAGLMAQVVKMKVDGRELSTGLRREVFFAPSSTARMSNVRVARSTSPHRTASNSPRRAAMINHCIRMPATFERFSVVSSESVTAECSLSSQPNGTMPSAPARTGFASIRGVTGEVTRLLPYATVRRQQQHAVTRTAVDVGVRICSQVGQRSAAQRAIHGEARIGHRLQYRTADHQTVLRSLRHA